MADELTEPEDEQNASQGELPAEASDEAGPVAEPPAAVEETAKAPRTRAKRARAEESAETAGAAAPSGNKHWYVVKVQSGREESIKEAVERRVKIEGLDEYFGQIIIPVEKITEMRNGKRVVRERKLYPGYLMVEVEFNDKILYLFRETSGVGDFVGAGLHQAPPPMSEREVERVKGRTGKDVPGVTHAKPKFDRGDRVKVKDGTFAGMEGEVKEILEAKGLVRVELTIFGRPVPVELEYWQIENV